MQHAATIGVIYNYCLYGITLVCPL